MTRRPSRGNLGGGAFHFVFGAVADQYIRAVVREYSRSRVRCRVCRGNDRDLLERSAIDCPLALFRFSIALTV